MVRMRFLPLLLFVFACGTTKGTTRETAPKNKTAKRAGKSKKREKPGAFPDSRAVPKPTEREVRDFDRIWELVRRDDRRWPRERDRFRQRSDAAGYLIAGHLMRFYMQVNARRDRAAKQLVRVKNEIVEVGEPCAPALASMMVLDRIPMRGGGYFRMDDLTRQDCSDMLERIGRPAVPHLLRALQRGDLSVKGRRLTLLTLGGTRDRRAFKALSSHLRGHRSWQVRADAAIALGKLGDRRALGPLRDAVLEDKDRFVVKKAGEARYKILKGS